VDEKTFNFYYLFINTKKLHKEIGFDGNVCSMHGQAALTTVAGVFKSLFDSYSSFFLRSKRCKVFAIISFFLFLWGGIDSLWV